MTEYVYRGADGGPGEFGEFGELFSADKEQTNGASGLKCPLTVLENKQGYATKVFSLDQTGKLQKEIGGQHLRRQHSNCSYPGCRGSCDPTYRTEATQRSYLWRDCLPESPPAHQGRAGGWIVPRDSG